MTMSPLTSRARLPATLLLAIAALWLTGCATGSHSNVQTRSQIETRRPVPAHPQDAVPVRRTAPVPIAPPVAEPSPSPNPAVHSLLLQASEARSGGDLLRAQSLAERAQSLAPRDPACYLELARLYQQRGDPARARQMALRGLSLNPPDPAMRAQLQWLSASP